MNVDRVGLARGMPPRLRRCGVGAVCAAIALGCIVGQVREAGAAIASTSTSAEADDPSADIRALAAAGKAAEALRRADALIARYPGDPRLPFEKSVVLAEQKRTGEAIATLQRLHASFPDLPEALNNLAVLYAEQGDVDRARQALEDALHVLPGVRVAYANLGELNGRLASRAYARALHIDDKQAAPSLALIRTLTVPAGTAPAPPAAAAAQLASADAPMTPRSIAASSAPRTVVGSVASAAPPKPVASIPASVLATAASSPAASIPTTNRPAIVANAVTTTETTASRPAASAAARATAQPASARPLVASAPDAGEARDVDTAVHAWAAAWSQKSLAAYFAAYVAGYRGNEPTAAAWQSARKLRILGKARINVEISRLTVDISQPGAVRVTFHQDYAADQLRVSSQKTLDLVKQDGKWLIRRESAGQ